MKERVYIFLSLLASALLVVLTAGCTKKNLDNDLPYITFGVAGLDADTKSDTKALITSETLPSQNVFIYGVRNNTNTIFAGDQIFRQENTSNWNVVANNRRQWAPGSSYSFYGFTSGIEWGNNNTIWEYNNGLSIKVSQPDKYSEEHMVDYMLSHAYKVADGSNYHVVMLYMQHAMAWVEIVVKKQMQDHRIRVSNITLRNIFRSATMQCTAQAIANSGDNNVWETTLEGDNNLVYEKKTDFTTTYTDKSILGKMSILAVPQQIYRETVLSVTYIVDENGINVEGGEKTYTESFNLFNYVPFVWESGHKITYTLTINTGVELKAQISDWKEAGYTEGIILPSTNSTPGTTGGSSN